VHLCPNGPVSFVMAEGGEGRRRSWGGVVAGGRRGRNGAMEAPPERGRAQGVPRWPKGPVSFGMAVMAAKPTGGSGANRSGIPSHDSLGSQPLPEIDGIEQTSS